MGGLLNLLRSRRNSQSHASFSRAQSRRETTGEEGEEEAPLQKKGSQPLERKSHRVSGHMGTVMPKYSRHCMHLFSSSELAVFFLQTSPLDEAILENIVPVPEKLQDESAKLKKKKVTALAM